MSTLVPQKSVLYYLKINLLRSFFLKKNSQTLKYLLTGFGLAVAAAAGTRQYKTQQKMVKLDKILEDVKASLRHEGQIGLKKVLTYFHKTNGLSRFIKAVSSANVMKAQINFTSKLMLKRVLSLSFHNFKTNKNTYRNW